MQRDEYENLTPAEYADHVEAWFDRERIENARHGIAPPEVLPSLLDLRKKPPACP